ncbi:MAG: sulfotransferase domain-containing protein [Desulfobacteraceae bacterium]|nr:sulfotransferase domain-containing protein [Desulfobacteraceae bacterium]
MYEKIRRFIKDFRNSATASVGGSFPVEDKAVIDAFQAEPDNTFLVSFPRTGSHWLRMLMELYFGRPSLTRVFYYPNRRDYLTLHTHDLNLTVERSHVLYLYRDPVDTVYSQLQYHREPFQDPGRIDHWSELYGRHLDKWLCRERFTVRKTVLTFEAMKTGLSEVFTRIAGHFGEAFDPGRLEEAARRVTKAEVKAKTPHDPQAVQIGPAYASSRERFRRDFHDRVWDTVFRERNGLKRVFSTESPGIGPGRNRWLSDRD